MSFVTAVQAIDARLAANWTTTEIREQNDDKQPPRDSEGGPSPWVMLEILNGDDEQASIGAPGNNLFRRTGIVFVHVFVPTGTGDALALQYATQIGAIFRGQTFGNSDEVTCEGASIGGGEIADENGIYYRRSVSIPFWTDDTA